METLLKSINFSYPKPEAFGQVGQDSMENQAQFGLKDSSSICQNRWAGSSARIEHHPPKVGVVGSNPTPPASFVLFFLLVEVEGY